MTKKIVVSEEVAEKLKGFVHDTSLNRVYDLRMFMENYLFHRDYSVSMTEELEKLELTLVELATIFETGEYEVDKKCPFEVGDLVKWESSYSGRIEILKVHDITGSTMSFTDGLQLEWERSKVTLVCKAKEDRVSMY